MNYKTTLVIAGIAAAAFAVLGSVVPILENANAQLPPFPPPPRPGDIINSLNSNNQGDNNQGSCDENCNGNINQQGNNNFQSDVD
jgi:hypothetical protein